MDFHDSYPERYRVSFAPDKFMMRRLKVQTDLDTAKERVRRLTDSVYDHDWYGPFREKDGHDLAKWSRRLHQAHRAKQREETWVNQQLYSELIRLDPLVLQMVCDDLPRALAIAQLMTLNSQHSVEQLMKDGIATEQEVAHAVAGARFCLRIWFAMSNSQLRAQLRIRLTKKGLK